MTDDCVGAYELTSEVEWGVCLANVDTGGADCKVDVYTVVDEDGDVVLVAQGFGLSGNLDELARVDCLFADLNQGDPSLERFFKTFIIILSSADERRSTCLARREELSPRDEVERVV